MMHEQFMRRAVELAKQASRYPFGAVIVCRDDGMIVGEGFNRSDLNPTFHGEIVAIADCANKHSGKNWQSFDLYSTAEPCAMCQAAIAWAGIGRIFYGTSIPFLQKQGWPQIDIRASEISAKAVFNPVQVCGGILEAECNDLYLGKR